MPSKKKPAPPTWVQIRPRRSRLQAQNVEFRFSPEYILSFWSPRAGQKSRPAVRTNGNLPGQEMLLLDDVILLPTDSMFVRAWLVSGRVPEHYHMRVELFTPPTVKQNVRVTLYWGTNTYDAIIQAGQCCFEDITPPDYSRHKNNLPTHLLSFAYELETRRANGINEKHKTDGSNGKH